VQKSIEVDLARISHYDRLLNDVELMIVNTAKQQDAQTFYRLQSVPGIGKILSLVMLYESHTIARFPRVQDFVSYCRLVKCAKASAGKRYGTSGTKIGNAYLQWAFSEAAVLFLRDNPAGQTSLARLEKKHGQGKALTILAQKLARAVYFMLTRDTVFAMATFLHSEGSGVGEPTASLGHNGLSRETVLCNDVSIASLNAHEHIGAWP
jgi:transposase